MEPAALTFIAANFDSLPILRWLLPLRLGKLAGSWRVTPQPWLTPLCLTLAAGCKIRMFQSLDGNNLNITTMETVNDSEAQGLHGMNASCQLGYKSSACCGQHLPAMASPPALKTSTANFEAIC